MLEKHEKKQKVAYQIIKNEIDNNKLSHAYIIESNRCADTNDFIYCMLADILDKPELYEVIKNNNYPDVKFMQTLDLQFKKSEILELQKEFKTKPLYGKYKIYVIKEANKLGENLSNIMLKFIEEPEEGVIAFFVVDNEHQLLDTIVSRCQVIPLNSNNTYEKTFENFYILNCIPYKSIEEIYTQVDTLVKFCICIEKYKHEAIIYENKYFTSLFTNKGEYYRAFEIMLLVYREVLLYKNNMELEYMMKYKDVIKNIAKINTAENICKKMHLILDSKNSLNANLNLGLVLDNLIFKMGEC